MKRIAIIGPESSGKTTLSRQLAECLGVAWVPEFARAYLEERKGQYEVSDLVTIAEGQFNSWMEFDPDRAFVSDTDILVVKVWSDYKYGQTDLRIMELLQKQQFDHYFLCRPDIPWEEDPLREHPEQREHLFGIYLRELEQRGYPFTIIEGDLQQRIAMCLKVVAER